MFLDQLFELCGGARCYGCRQPGSWLCSGCMAGLAPPYGDSAIPNVDRFHCPWRYEGSARDLVLALKLRHQRAAAKPLAAAIVTVTRRDGTEAAMVTWVPARRADRRTRGFDHAEVIARHVAGRLGLPVAGVLARTSARPDQVGLGRAQRWKNLAGAFTSRPAAGVVLLVDDLVTTGATASACARALRAGGATQVELATPCRA